MQQMTHYTLYASPLGNLLIAAEPDGISGLWFEGQKNAPCPASTDGPDPSQPLLAAAVGWLDAYFSGQRPPALPPLLLRGTAFQLAVWRQLTLIPYGTTTTYQAIGQAVARLQGRRHLSAQAVGQAVGRNPVSLMVPCHRVIGSNGHLTGYAGGIGRKRRLLELEQAIILPELIGVSSTKR